ncbi:MAG: NOL1/NOP2/sun family putative RNA methylase [Clostridiaceae bacterium]|jgi:NOL1/NOP2/sun family putative RNA methylase|nr:NOL1/NOP2/sun family putative RNA methylase [Clostridiaceae bacterium]
MRIPSDFKKKFRELMESWEYDEFISSLSGERAAGIRINRLKVNQSEWSSMSPFKIEPVPWADGGYYLDEEERPGIHPYYHAGLYYIQEPSAMFPSGLLEASPDDRVLDLCAAPGGKTVGLAMDMRNRGFILSNDVNPKRIKALVKNIELLGIVNTVIANESPERLASAYEGFFNKIMLDMPCSGEGMFRKDPEAGKSWNRYKAEEMQRLQREIFDSAYRMMSPGGLLVYSTCTFNPEENEQNVSWILKNYPDLYLKEIKKTGGIESGRPDWSDGNPELLKTARLWPHKVNGEGHFAALFAKQGIYRRNDPMDCPGTEPPSKSFLKFCGGMFHTIPRGIYEMRGTELHMPPCGYIGHPNIRIVKTGLYLGCETHGKFEPSQSFAMALEWNNIKRKRSFSVNDADLIRYLKGETLPRFGEKGYIALGVEGYPVGWGKIEENGLKNLYPKGWRRTR